MSALVLRAQDVYAQGQPTFTKDKALIATQIDARPEAFVDFLENGLSNPLTQGQLIEIEAWAIPNPTVRREIHLREGIRRDHDMLRLPIDDPGRLMNDVALADAIQRAGLAGR